MTSFKCALFSLVLACVACGDDDADSPARPDGSIDASMDASDARDASDGDSSVQPDAARDSSLEPDASDTGDAGDAAVCERVAEPLLPTFESTVNATRLPLAALCGDEPCVRLDDFAADLECTDLGDDASIEDVDLDHDAGSGCCFNWWIRTEGCGNVQYSAHETWPRIYNFDAESGALVGRARYDDIEYDVGGCTDWAFVAGELLRDCPAATQSVCLRD